MTDVGVDALGQEVRVGDTVVSAGGEYNRVLGSAGTRYSLGEWEVTGVTPQSFWLREISDTEGRKREQLRRNHEVVKIGEGLIGTFEYGIAKAGTVLYNGLTKEQAEAWVYNEEKFDPRSDSDHYVVRRAHGEWVKL